MEKSEKEVERLKKENEELSKHVEAEKKKDEEVTQLKDRVAELEDEVKFQFAVITIKVKAAMANKFLLGKFKKKEKDLHTMVNDYLIMGGFKDLESEEKKEDAADATMSTTESGLLDPGAEDLAVTAGDDVGNADQ